MVHAQEGGVLMVHITAGAGPVVNDSMHQEVEAQWSMHQEVEVQW